MKRLLTLIALLLPALLPAQSHVTIHGKVTGTNGKTIPNAQISILTVKDSTLLKTVAAGIDGRYEITTEAPTGSLIKAAAAGYTPQVVTVGNTAAAQPVDFVLIPGKTLAEVTVTTTKPLYEQKIDRTVFNVENSITATGGDALDALKKTPGVQVLNNEVNIAGKASVSLMINGRLQQVSGKDLIQLLRSIPADNLSKIEVITTPPAKYDAEGNAGMINIVMKKNLKKGLNGSATASYNVNSFGSPALSTNLNYRQEKLNLFANVNGGIQKWRYTNKTGIFFSPQSWAQHVQSDNTLNHARAQLGADYKLTRESNIAITYTQNRDKENDVETISSRSTTNGITDSTVMTTGNSKEDGSRHTLNLNYEWRIDTTGKKLTADIDYYTQHTDHSTYFRIRDYAANGNAGYYTDNRILTAPTLTIKSVKTDIEYPLKLANLFFGAKAAMVSNNNDNRYETMKDDVYTADLSRTNTFHYQEQTQAAYISAQKSLGKYELQLGLRAEHTQTTGYLPLTRQTNKNEYLQFFPTGYIQYTPHKNHVINIGFSRRIKRPGYNMLNPYRYYYSNSSYMEGNPALRPSFSNAAEIAYTFRSAYTLKAYVNQTDNYWDRIISTDAATGITSMTRANIGRARYCGMNMNVFLKPAAWWELRGSLNGSYSQFQLHYLGGDKLLDGYNAWIEGGSSFFLNKAKTFSAEVSGYYYTPRQKDYKYWDKMSAVYLGVRAQLLQKSLIIAMNVDDLFQKAFWFQTNEVNGTTEYSYDDEQSIRASITYKFGNRNVRSRRERGAVIEELERVK